MAESRTKGLTSQHFWLMCAAIALMPGHKVLADEPTGALEEIVVTATKRESTVQTTPISITAISGEEIQARGLPNLTALMQSVPGVSMKTSGPGQTEFEMRGLSSSAGYSPTVGFYLDDTPLTAPAASTNSKVVIDPNLYDLTRVEVLRGPQGTLYGAGSMGGTIKLIPNAPNSSGFDASAEAILGGTDGGGFNHVENGMLNLPLSVGSAALRIVASQDHESGWIDRVVIGNGDFPLPTNSDTVRGNLLDEPIAARYRDVNDENLTSARISLLWEPTEQLKIVPSYFFQRLTMDGLSDIDSVPGTNAHYQPFDVAEPFSDELHLASLNVQYHIDGVNITSTTSHWTRAEVNNQDASEQLQTQVGVPSYYTSNGGVGTADTVEHDLTKQTSEELRFSSADNTRFQWLLGYFYSNFRSDNNETVIAPGAVPLFGSDNAFANFSPIIYRQNAVFADFTYQFTTKLKGEIGLRRFSYDSTFANTSSGFLLGSNTWSTVVSGENNQGTSPKFNLSYQENEDLLLYATAAKGFRPGGGNYPLPTTGLAGDLCESELQAIHGTTSYVAPPNTFGPDSLWSYEIGEKASGFNHRLTFNGDFYYENWSGIQQTIPLNCGFGFYDNAGDAHVYGSEVEVKALLVEGLIVSASGGYTHARIVSTLPATGIPTNSPVQDIPEWTSSLRLTYRHPISENLKITSAMESNYVGSRTDVGYAVGTLSSYTLTNFRLGLAGNQLSATIFVSNLFDRLAIESFAPQLTVQIPTFNRLAVNQPRTIGIDFTWQPGR